MQKRSHMEISSLIVILSIITILVQFSVYYFFTSNYIVIGIAGLITALCTHILLEQTSTYESAFIYLLLNLFISIIIVFLIYIGNNQNILPYTDVLIAIVAINWFIPTLHCYFRDMLDYGTRVEEFGPFYRNSSVLFNLFYISLLLYFSLNENAIPWAYRTTQEQPNFTPFWSIATQIEDYLNQLLPLSDILSYLGSRILFLIPYGFYSTLILRRRSRTIRFLILLLLPIIIESLQFILIPKRFDIDDIIYALIGGLAGALLFYLNNWVYRAISGKLFLAKDSDYRYSRNSLHF